MILTRDCSEGLDMDDRSALGNGRTSPSAARPTPDQILLEVKREVGSVEPDGFSVAYACHIRHGVTRVRLQFELILD